LARTGCFGSCGRGRDDIDEQRTDHVMSEI
jgi:hypothetical protein